MKKVSILITIFLLFASATAAAKSKLYRMYYSTGYQGGFEMGTFDRQQRNACDPDRYANGFRIKGRKFMLDQKRNIGYEDEDIINGLMDGYYNGYKDGCKRYSKNYNYEIVVKLQKRLTDEGYSPGKIDGIWGRKTENALREFQKK